MIHYQYLNHFIIDLERSLELLFLSYFRGYFITIIIIIIFKALAQTFITGSVMVISEITPQKDFKEFIIINFNYQIITTITMIIVKITTIIAFTTTTTVIMKTVFQIKVTV